MKKLLIGVAVCILFAMTTLFAADAYWLPWQGTLAESTWVQQAEYPYREFLFDTCTIKYIADSVIDLGTTYYNFALRTLNGAGDSGSCLISFGQTGGKGIWHDDSVAFNLNRAAVGLNTANDYLIAPIGARYIYYRGVVGGTADTACILEIRAVR